MLVVLQEDEIMVADLKMACLNYYCSFCLAIFGGVSGAQRGKSTSQNEAEKQDFWVWTGSWLVPKNDRLDQAAQPQQGAHTPPDDNDADGTNLWCGVETLFQVEVCGHEVF
jgi:hypothetical protein